ncbi:TM0996/MTH895 family glutaredoxin-like protein [bacterium]|nr:TM0996/MTH895 family glutaredoxin-like protein [bacterium]
MIIKVLGSGCPSCQLLKHNAEETIKQLELHDVEIDYITDVNEIVDYGVMSSPALVIGDDIKTAGRIASIDEIKGWLQYLVKRECICQLFRRLLRFFRLRF